MLTRELEEEEDDDDDDDGEELPGDEENCSLKANSLKTGTKH